jgi:predicted peptidase
MPGLGVRLLIAAAALGASAAAGVEPAQTGFIDKVYTSPDAPSAWCVVFIPHGYDGSQALPLIVYLHGSGAIGRDGRRQIRGGLAQVIRAREKTFPFIAVFPQSQTGGWAAGSPEGKRVMAILAAVQKDYRVDAKRMYLTGVSMGGEGTWGLAAAYPTRWAAIVPICGVGDPATAPAIKDIPCWCFHGDADDVVKVGRSRVMIKALRDAGGRPLYHEYPGVGHNCWERAYANADLFEWLLQQHSK